MILSYELSVTCEKQSSTVVVGYVDVSDTLTWIGNTTCPVKVMRTTKILIALVVLVALTGGTAGVASAEANACGEAGGIPGITDRTGQEQGEASSSYAQNVGPPGQNVPALCNPDKHG